MKSRCDRCGTEFAEAGCPACPKLPTFAGVQLAGLAAVTKAKPRPPAAPRERGSHVPYLVIAFLATVLLVMSGWIALHPRRPVVVQVSDRAGASAMSIDDPKIEIEAPSKQALETSIEGRTSKATGEATRPSARAPRRAPRTAARETTQATEATPTRGPTPPSDKEPNCAGDPKAPGCDGGPELPATLEMQASRAAIAEVKHIAKACGSRYGAAAGVKVMVKLSIVGATGQVENATPEGVHAGTPLGRCVADALAGATFPRFRKHVVGVRFTTTM